MTVTTRSGKTFPSINQHESVLSTPSPATSSEESSRSPSPVLRPFSKRSFPVDLSKVRNPLFQEDPNSENTQSCHTKSLHLESLHSSKMADQNQSGGEFSGNDQSFK